MPVSDPDERRKMNKTYRGRRLLACRAEAVMLEVIAALPEGPYSQIRDGFDVNEGPFPGTTPQMKAEMVNMAKLLLRMVLTQNDGRVSSSRLNGF